MTEQKHQLTQTLKVELFDTIINTEANMSEWYSEAAKQCTTPDLKKMFALFAAEETKHADQFLQIKQEAVDQDVLNFTSTVEKSIWQSDMTPLLVYLSQTALITKAQADFKNIKNATSAITYAIDQEQHSIFLYQEIKALLPKSVQNDLIKIISVEREHFAKLLKAKTQIQKLDEITKKLNKR